MIEFSEFNDFFDDEPKLIFYMRFLDPIGLFFFISIKYYVTSSFVWRIAHFGLFFSSLTSMTTI